MPKIYKHLSVEERDILAVLRGQGQIASVLNRSPSRKGLTRKRGTPEFGDKCSGGAGLWIIWVDIGSVWASEKSRELFHFAPDEKLNYDSFFKAVHPEDHERVNKAIQQTLRSGDG